MDTLSILPAVDLMLPAALPFLSTALLLWIVPRIPGVKSWSATGDLIVLSGILLAFFVFDRPSIIHLANPSRPMDWIPALALLTFAARRLLSALHPLISDILTVTISAFILLYPLLHRHMFSGMALLAEILGLWLLVQILPFRHKGTGLDRAVLTPLFLTTATLAALSPLSGSLLLGQLAGGLAAVWLAMILAGSSRTPLAGAEPGIALGGLLLVGREYVDISLYVTGTLYAALLSGILTHRLLLRFPFFRSSFRTLLPGIISLLFLGLAIVKTIQSSAGAGSGY